MADIADEQTQQILRTIVREETLAIVREETRAIIQAEVPTIVLNATSPIHANMGTIRKDLNAIHKDLSGMREDIKLIRYVQGQQSITLHALTTDVRQIKLAVRDHAVRLHDLESVTTNRKPNL